jgi:membrane-associated phospholipid phosphatase
MATQRIWCLEEQVSNCVLLIAMPRLNACHSVSALRFTICHSSTSTDNPLTGWLFGYAAGIPLIFLILWAVVSRPGWHKAHVTILGLFISLILASFLTDVVKNSVGRPRPDLIARCKPKPRAPKHSLVTFEICSETNHHVLHDGWRSFPSGHSSFAFSGLGYLSMYVPEILQNRLC